MGNFESSIAEKYDLFELSILYGAHIIPNAIVLTTNAKRSETYMSIHYDTVFNLSNGGTIRIYQKYYSNEYIIRVMLNVNKALNDENYLKNIYKKILSNVNEEEIPIIYLITKENADLESKIKNVFKNIKFVKW